MSSIGSSSGIHFSGLSSGIDTESIIAQLIAIEKQPITALASQKGLLQLQFNATQQYRDLAQTLKNAVDDLTSSSSFRLAKAVSSNSDAVAVSATSDAQAGVYNIAVSKLAQAHKIRTNAQTDSTSALNLSGTININGTDIVIEAADSLSAVAAKINAANAGVTASLINGGANNVYMTLTANETGTAHAITRSDTSGNVLSTLGLLSGNEILAAQDAAFSIDGIDFTSGSNTVTDIVPSVTLTLLQADDTTPVESTVTISRDAAGIRQKIEALASAYNNIVDFLNVQASFNSDTLATGPLFGDSAIQNLQATLFNTLTNSPNGLSGDYKNLLAIGIDFDSNGKMTVDASKVESALNTNLANVDALFRDTGTIANTDVRFVSATAKTKGSGSIGYVIDITQAATQGTASAGTSMTSGEAAQETLTFGGALLGNTSYNLTVAAGTTLDQLISQINSDGRLKDLLTASKDGSDHLVLTSKRYGTPGSFTVVSDTAAGSDNSGIGTTILAGTGLDVAGTINGEPATGSGQFLTGNAGNANTEGLQIQITGTQTGNLGTMIFTRGAASVTSNVLAGALDFTSGVLSASMNSLQAQMNNIDDSISQINDRAAAKEDMLRTKFSAMEAAISALQSQMNQLNSILKSMTSSG